MNRVVPTDAAPRAKRRATWRGKAGIGLRIFGVLGVSAWIAVACSSGDPGSGEQLGEQASAVRCNQDDCPGLPPHEPCGSEGNRCCLNGACQTGLVCDSFNTCSACGNPGQPCCANNACAANSACNGGTCERSCGVAGKPCCSGSCDSGFVCSGGSCTACGGSGQSCCSNNTCNGGFNCVSGTCTSCGHNGQACCSSGAACGGGLYCATGNTCKPVPCGYNGTTCCPGAAWQQCLPGGTDLACDWHTNTCTHCGGQGQLCCPNGIACSSAADVCETSGFNSGTCQHCGYRGETCCSWGASCIGSVCNTSTGKCQ